MSHSNNWQNDDNSDAAGSPEHNYDTPADSSDSDSDDGAIVLKARITALRIELNILEQQLDKRKRKKARGIASGIAKKTPSHRVPLPVKAKSPEPEPEQEPEPEPEPELELESESHMPSFLAGLVAASSSTPTPPAHITPAPPAPQFTPTNIRAPKTRGRGRRTTLAVSPNRPATTPAPPSINRLLETVQAPQSLIKERGVGKGTLLRRRLGISEMNKADQTSATIYFYREARRHCGQDLSHPWTWYVEQRLAGEMVANVVEGMKKFGWDEGLAKDILMSSAQRRVQNSRRQINKDIKARGGHIPRGRPPKSRAQE